MTDPHRVCLRLMDQPAMEGAWLMIEGRFNPRFFRDGAEHPVILVSTGAVEWDGNACAEVYVPEDRMELWKAEHDVDR